MRLVLASASPRRQQLLAEAGYDLLIDPAHIGETALPNESPEDHVRRLAEDKSGLVAKRHPSAYILGADTIVVDPDGNLLGKPADLPAAGAMLQALSGRVHRVLTGVCIRRLSPAFRHSWVCETQVHFRALTPPEIAEYLALVSPFDKAGGYAIQERGDLIVEKIEGLYSNVVGLPIEEIVAFLAPAGVGLSAFASDGSGLA